MLSIRLNSSLEQELAVVSSLEHKTKTAVIKDALHYYFNMLKAKEKITPYELGQGLFGVAGSGDGNLSSSYKESYKKMLHEKYNHR